MRYHYQRNLYTAEKGERLQWRVWYN